ncbi:MAG: glycosyltransferase [Actinobacteria bacterium]|nr:glycosyltransferase [Actinomycetota bacterium]
MATDSRGPTLSIVIVAWNSSAELGRTIPPLLAELSAGDELVVVDNDSADRTPELVAELAPEATLIRMRENTGFAAGANTGAAAASGELLVLLNPDAAPQPGFGEAIRRPLADARGWGAWMGLVTAGGGRVVNTRGGVLHFTGIAWAGGAGEPIERIEPAEVPFLSGACLALPRATWDRLGGFCGRYFLYHEDVDLSLRLRLAGERIGIEPAAVVDHEYEFSANPAKYRHLERNRWQTLLRDYPAPLLALLAPALLLTELGLWAAAIAGGWARLKWDAGFDVLRSLGPALRERRAIQDERRIEAGEFAAFLTPELDSPYLGAAGRIAPLRWGLRGYWWIVRALLRAPDHP